MIVRLIIVRGYFFTLNIDKRINEFKASLISKIMLGVRDFNEKHRSMAKITTALALFLIVVLSAVLTATEKVCAFFCGHGALGKRALGVLLAALLLFVTSRASIFVPPVIDTIVGNVELTESEETKVEETKSEDTKVEDTKSEETKVEDTKTEETKAEETKVEEADTSEIPEASQIQENVAEDVAQDTTTDVTQQAAGIEGPSSNTESEATTDSVTSSTADSTEAIAKNAPTDTDFSATTTDIDLKSFTQDHPETVGWIYFEGSQISYPIMQSGDNKKYKTVDYTGAEARTGAIFLDYRSASDFSDYNSIVYGHNMKDGTMFGSLRDYRKDPEYYNDHQYFYIIVPGKKYRYQIFAYMDVPESYVIYDYVGDASYEFVKDAEPVRIKSYMDSEIPVNTSKKVVTLSTCTDKDDLQFVILGVLVDEEDY